MDYLTTIDFPEFDEFIKSAKFSKENDAQILILNDDDKKDKKSKRASVNKTLKDFKSQAKLVRDEVVGQFDSKVKEVSSLLNEHQEMLKAQIEDYDTTWKNERQAFIDSICDLYLHDEEINFINYFNLAEESFLNFSVSESQIKKSIDEKFTKIKTDYQVAQAISAQVADIFKQTLDVAQAVEIDKQQQEELQRRHAVEEAEKARAEKERAEIEAKRKERERQAMIEAELKEASENGEVIDAEKVREIHQKADDYANRETTKQATCLVTFNCDVNENPVKLLELFLNNLDGLNITEAF